MTPEFFPFMLYGIISNQSFIVIIFVRRSPLKMAKLHKSSSPFHVLLAMLFFVKADFDQLALELIKIIKFHIMVDLLKIDMV